MTYVDTAERDPLKRDQHEPATNGVLAGRDADAGAHASDVAALAKKTGQVPLLPEPPSSWKPQGIFYGMIACKMTRQGLQFFYRKLLEDSRTDIDRFVDDILRRKFRVGRFLRNIPQRLHLGPLDLNIPRPSYVVLELDRTLNWRFRPDVEAITMKEEGLTQYSALRHVSPTSEHSPAWIENCNIAYFAVSDTSGPDNAFNLNVQLIQHSPSGLVTTIDIVIDPDIPNTGGPGHRPQRPRPRRI